MWSISIVMAAKARKCNVERVIQPGQQAAVTRTFSQEDLDRFAALSGDDNPIHVDPAFSARTRFGHTVLHGMLLYGAISAVLGTRLPGPGCVQLEQGLMFPAPTYPGEKVTVRVTVTDVDRERAQAGLETVVVRPGGEVGCQGQTRVALSPGGRIISAKDTEGVENASPPSGGSFKGLVVGRQAETRRIFTPADLAEYVDLTGDGNPVFAGLASQRLIPGSLLGGLFSYLLGTRLPGPGTNYLKQHLLFLTPAHPGQEITARVTITRLRPEKGLVNLRTVCTLPTGEVVCDGEALVLARDVAVTGV